MGLPSEDMLSSYQQLLTTIKSFKGVQPYIIDTIRKVSEAKPKVNEIPINTVSDVIDLLSKIKTNRL